jgi:hypothetical protein
MASFPVARLRQTVHGPVKAPSGGHNLRGLSAAKRHLGPFGLAGAWPMLNSFIITDDLCWCRPGYGNLAQRCVPSTTDDHDFPSSGKAPPSLPAMMKPDKKSRKK